MDFLGVELKQTLFYQEIADEERREGIKEESMTLLTRLLRRKFGLQPALETAQEQLPGMEQPRWKTWLMPCWILPT